MKILRSIEKVDNIHFKMGRFCCLELQKLYEHDNTEFRFGSIRLNLKGDDEVETDFKISFCPFCGERIDEVEEETKGNALMVQLEFPDDGRRKATIVTADPAVCSALSANPNAQIEVVLK